MKDSDAPGSEEARVSQIERSNTQEQSPGLDADAAGRDGGISSASAPMQDDKFVRLKGPDDETRNTTTHITNAQDKSPGQLKSDQATRKVTVKKDLVYRLRSLPLDFDVKMTRTLVSVLLKLEDNDVVFQIRSFAEAHDGQTNVATLNFRETPDQLFGVHEWTRDIPDSLQFAQAQNDSRYHVQRRRRITFDDHFRGLTVLYCPQSSEHEVE